MPLGLVCVAVIVCGNAVAAARKTKLEAKLTDNCNRMDIPF